jgi:hypothetical protein
MIELCGGAIGRSREQPECHGLQVLEDGREVELVACAGQAAQPKPLEGVMGLEVSKTHLDSLSLVA